MFFQFSFAKFIGNTKTKSRQPSMNWYKSTFGAERFFQENSYLWNEGQKKFYLLFFWLFGFTLQSYYWKSFSKNALNRKIFRKNVQFEGLLVWTSFYFSDFSARRKKCETPLLNWDHSFVRGKKAAALRIWIADAFQYLLSSYNSQLYYSNKLPQNLWCIFQVAIY